MTVKTNAEGRHCCTKLTQGMIDAHAHHNSGAVCPLPLLYNQVPAGIVNGWKRENVEWLISTKIVELLMSINFSKGVNIQSLSTVEMGRFLVELNTAMYKENNSSVTFEEYKELFDIKKDKSSLLKGTTLDKLSQSKRERWDDLEEKEKAFHKKREAVLKEVVPSLIIVPTMDMELAHLDGYDGKFIYSEEGGKVFYRKRTSVSKSQPLGKQENIDISHERIKSASGGESKNSVQDECEVLDEDDSLKFQKWRRQVEDTESAAASNPLRLFPLFFYDPRRYRYKYGESQIKNCSLWDEPFARIVGSVHKNSSVEETSRVWFGFKMYPSLGYRPFDELCEHLPRFYKKCEDGNIPILTHCSPGGMTTHEAKFYEDYDKINYTMRKDKLDERIRILGTLEETNGNDIFNAKDKMDYFYKTYGHPESWRPVLKNFPKLHLCLAHFGGDKWEKAWVDPNNLDEWINSIVDLTREYDNVYTDLSCLNLNNSNIMSGLKLFLEAVHSDNDKYKHLKNKIIFGSDWYLTYMTQKADTAQYSVFCNKFKDMFNKIDSTGEFWKRAALINPWKCYSLSVDKFENMLKTIAKVNRADFDPDAAQETYDKLEDLFENHIEGNLCD